jgi:hypothetical protein
MADNPNQPREDDVVLGGQNSAPVGGVVLGGVEGVKRRLASAVEEEQITALWEALKYGDVGLGLVIQALNHESGQVRWAAYRLLRERTEPVVKSPLQEYVPLNSAVRVDYSRLQELLRAGTIPGVFQMGSLPSPLSQKVIYLANGFIQKQVLILGFLPGEKVSHILP